MHESIERIPEEEIVAAQRFLEYLARGAAFRATLSAPPDDEPITDGDARSIARAHATYRPAKWFRTRTFSANSEFDEVHVA